MSSSSDPEAFVPGADLMQSASVLEEWAAELNYLVNEWRDEHQETLTLLIAELRQHYPDATSFLDALHSSVVARQDAREAVGRYDAEGADECAPAECETPDAGTAKRQRLGALSPRLVTRILRKAGFTLRNGSGNHVVVAGDQGSNSVVSMNGGFGGDLGPKHLSGIAKQLGRDPRELFGK